MKRSPTPSVPRRSFLQSTGLAAAVAFASDTIASGSEVTARRQIPVTLETDVLVCGGGCAGLGAALSAARSGARTVLLERAGFAGGIITAAGLPFFDGIAHIKTNRIVVRGIALELLSKSGVCAPDARTVKVHNPTIPSTFEFKLLTDKLLTAEADRLRVLFHSTVCDVVMEGDRVSDVLVANKAGLMRIKAKVVIDCTGDADVAAWAGAPTEKLTELQPTTLHFRIGNVKGAAGLGKKCRASLETAHARGDLPMFYGPGVMFMYAPNEVYIHGIRVPADAVDPFDLTRAEMQGRRDAWTMFEAWKRDLPEFADAYFIESSPYLGVRETRRIVGQHVLTEQEITANKKFDDAIATGCWYLDQHPNKSTPGSANATPKIQPEPYDIPYRSLLPRQVANLLVAGRCHSATQLAASSTRVTVTAMAMGQAAGVAAAMACGDKVSPQEIAGADIRARLHQQGGGPFLEG